MDQKYEIKYKLAPGTQVREEDFGLLFYTMDGPRLYFLASGKILSECYFRGKKTLKSWLEETPAAGPPAKAELAGLKKTLERLSEKGVIVEC